MHVSRRGTLVVFALIVVLGLSAVAPRSISCAYGELVLYLNPSAEKAAKFGDAHFEAFRSRLYDIACAERMYVHAATLDAKHPYVHHQLARIAFLRGDFFDALLHINTQIEVHGEALPPAFYVRGLILGYMGRYHAAAKDYEHYLEFDPHNWAAVNDYAWVLLKAGQPAEALAAIEDVLPLWEENPWLLNSAAISAYEVHELTKARDYITRAAEHVAYLTEKEWLVAYPGNDPRIAGDGIAALKKSILNNMHTITSARDDSAVQ